MNNSSFLGRGWTFPPVFENKRGSVVMVSDEDDILQSLKIILSTRRGERLTNPYFGCAMHDYLFNPIDDITKYMIVDAIKSAILDYEPRIDLEEVNVDLSEQLDGTVNVELVYLIRKINVRSNIVFPFYKLEGTLVDEV